MMVQYEDKSNYALVYAASFWRETQLVPKIKSLMVAQDLENQHVIRVQGYLFL
jgi:hypothetical protein